MKDATRNYRKTWRLAVITAGFTLLPAIALAAEATKEVAVDPQVAMAKYISAGLAMGMSALGAGYAQAKIGSAGAGTLAENPDAAAMVIVLQALPEVIVLLGFVSALILSA